MWLFPVSPPLLRAVHLPGEVWQLCKPGIPPVPKKRPGLFSASAAFCAPDRGRRSGGRGGGGGGGRAFRGRPFSCLGGPCPHSCLSGSAKKPATTSPPPQAASGTTVCLGVVQWPGWSCCTVVSSRWLSECGPAGMGQCKHLGRLPSGGCAGSAPIRTLAQVATGAASLSLLTLGSPLSCCTAASMQRR